MSEPRDRWGYKYTEQMFDYLKEVAPHRETVFYMEITSDIGGSPQSVGGRELTALADECRINGWPELNALVVAKKNGLSLSGLGSEGLLLYRLFMKVNLSTSKQTEIIENCCDISRRDQLPISEIIY